MTIENEIKQKKFKNEFHKAEVNLLFTSSWKTSQRIALMKPFSITPQQYNILRILKGQYPAPAPLKLLTERMIDKMSNTSRLVEKLNKKGWVSRKNCEKNRRQVDILITEKGIRICDEITAEIDADLKKNNSNLTEQEARELNRLLDKMRG
jgi:DNA-binding MarR family transcriptional regulator